jgi:hypothetical protein
MEDKWEAYEAAEKALTDFDAKHDGIRSAFMSLGEALKIGWEAVRFEQNPESQNRAGMPIDDGITPTNLAALSANIHSIVLQRQALVQKRREAFRALPETLRGKLCSARKAKSRNERRR